MIAPDAGAPRARLSKMFINEGGVNDALGAGLCDFAEFKDGVLFLTGKSWFHRPQYDHMRDLAWACAIETAATPPHR